MRDLLANLIVNKQKAIAAFAVTAVASFVARHGFTLDATLQAYLQALLLGAVAHAVVYLKANK